MEEAGECGSDTSVLVNHEVLGGSTHSNEINLRLQGCDKCSNSAFYGRGLALTNLRSPSECTTVSTLSNYSAGPLDNKHRYHIYFAYHQNDKLWAKNAIQILEAPPYNYCCCYGDRDFAANQTDVQNILCSVMLSLRIILVLSPDFINESWSQYEDAISHLTSFSQRRQKIVPVILRSCDQPESLRCFTAIESVSGTEEFWEILLQHLQLDGLSISDSLHTLKSLTTPTSGFQNGEVLVKLSASVQGRLKSRLVFDHEEVPETLSMYDVGLTQQEYADIVRAVGREDVGRRLPWLFTIVPNLVLGLIFVFWCAAFILVILLYPDSSSSTLPVRLCVFTLPAVCIVLGCLFRWKRLKVHKQKYSMRMFSRSIYMNSLLYTWDRPLVVTSAKTSDDAFHIYFLYFNRYECIEQVELCLSHCSDDDLEKLSRLVNVYTLSNVYLQGKPLACRLLVMMSSAYAINLVYRRVPHSLERRHLRRRQCLCQFVEEFLAAYLPCLNHEGEINSLGYMFSRYLNCQLRPDPVVLHSLGINIMS